jgi:hypothetical protein
LSAILVPVVQADFHILFYTDDAGLEGWTHILPSNQYNCKAVGHNGEVTTDQPGDSYFEATKDICGVAQLDFYQRADGHYDFYTPSGAFQGSCYNDSGAKAIGCASFSGQVAFIEELVCYTSICGPA